VSKEFRLAVTTKLPEDEFEQAAAVMACGKFKAEVIKLMETHKIVGAVGHEIVTPRGPNVAKTIPSAPPSQNAPSGDDQRTSGNLSGHPIEPIAGTAPKHKAA
jgi:hypothetical protein